MANLLAELKRRHIYRVAAAYAVVAWVLLQLFNNLEPILKLPDWAGTLVLVLLVGGFPVALLLAWVRELAPADGATARATTSIVDWALIGALGVVIALVSYQQLAPSPGAGTVQQAIVAPASSQPQPGGIAIAVLPFVNLSGDQGQEFFSDGMTEEINAALTKVSDLHVVARTSAFEFKGQNGNARAVGQALGATHLVEGSVRKAGNRVRITAQLVRAANGLNLWSENYDRDLTDIFAIQEEIAQAIATSLRVPLGLQQGETLVRSRTKGEASYEDYLRAKAMVRSRGGERLIEAAKLLETVVARDPEFAPAWALLGLAYGLIPNYQPAFASGAIEQERAIVETYLPKAEAASNRAIQLDPKNPDGYTALGAVQESRFKFLAAGDLFSRALALDPDNPDVVHLNSGMLVGLGYLKQALPMRQRLHVLEPFVPVFTINTAGLMRASGQTDAAMALAKSVPIGGRAFFSRVDAEQGHYGEAADKLLMIPAGIYLPDTVETAARLLRTAPTAVASPQSLPRLGQLEWVYLYVGAQGRVLDFYEDTLKIGYWATSVNLWGQPYAGIRKTERFKAYVRNAGMVDYWRAKGWPDLCRPMGADDFVCD